MMLWPNFQGRLMMTVDTIVFLLPSFIFEPIFTVILVKREQWLLVYLEIDAK